MIKNTKRTATVTSLLLLVGSVSSSIALAEPFVVHDQNGHVVQVPSASSQLPSVQSQEPSAEFREPSAQNQPLSAQNQPLSAQSKGR